MTMATISPRMDLARGHDLPYEYRLAKLFVPRPALAVIADQEHTKRFNHLMQVHG